MPNLCIIYPNFLLYLAGSPQLPHPLALQIDVFSEFGLTMSYISVVHQCFYIALSKYMQPSYLQFFLPAHHKSFHISQRPTLCLYCKSGGCRLHTIRLGTYTLNIQRAQRHQAFPSEVVYGTPNHFRNRRNSFSSYAFFHKS